MARPPTGTVQWSGDHWRARVTLEDGSRPWLDLPRSIGRDDRERAQAKARELAVYVREHGVRRTDEGLAGDAETVRQYAERWIAERERRGLRSVRDDRQRLNTHVLPLVGDTRIQALTARDCRAIVAALDSKVSGAVIAWRTALNAWGVFSKMMGDACGSKVEALRVRDDDPTSGVAPPDRGTERSKAYLYPSELLSLVSCSRVPLRWRRIYALAVYTYCRAGELEALRVEDIDVTRGVLHVHRATDRDTGEARETKTKHARRLPIEPTLRPLLVALAREAGEGSALVKMPPREDGAAHLRKHLAVAGVDRAELFADDATRTPITFHDLRATGITWRAVRGDEPLKIQRSAGHTDLNTTQRYIREAENLREGFGEVFPVLPRELLSTDDGGAGPSSDGGEGEKHETPDGVSSVETSTEGRVLRESLTLSRPCVAIPTGFESAPSRSTAGIPARNRTSTDGGTLLNRPDSPGSATPADDCGTLEPNPRRALSIALGEAVRAGLASGDAALVRVAARALGELIDPTDGPVFDLATERARRGER